MQIIKMELEFTESTEHNMKKPYFDSKTVEHQVEILNSANRKARKAKGYDKTYLYVTLNNGERSRVRIDLGDSIGFLENLSKQAGKPITIFQDVDPYTYSVEEHFDTEGGMGILVYGKDLKTMENAKVVLKRAKIERPCQDWVIILTPKNGHEEFMEGKDDETED